MDVFEIAHRGVTYQFEQTEGGYFAQVADLPGCFSEGETLDEAFANIREALDLYIDGSMAEDLPLPERYRTLFARAS